jgi:hypothetical protein
VFRDLPWRFGLWQTLLEQDVDLMIAIDLAIKAHIETAHPLWQGFI